MKLKLLKKIKFFPGPERKAMSAVSFAMMLVFAIMALHSAEDAFFYYEYTSTPEYKAVLVNSLVPANIPLFAEFSLLHPVLSTSVFCFFCANASVVSYGVWRGRPWGRISAVYIFYLLAAAALLIMPGIVIPQPLPDSGDEEIQKFNSFSHIATLVFRVLSALSVFLFVFLARYFERLSVYPKDNFYMPKWQ